MQRLLIIVRLFFRLVLASMSPLLANLLAEAEGPDTALLLPEVKAEDMRLLLQFIYQGEVVLPPRRTAALLPEYAVVRRLRRRLDPTRRNSIPATGMNRIKCPKTNNIPTNLAKSPIKFPIELK
jgi:hypothetical protein